MSNLLEKIRGIPKKESDQKNKVLTEFTPQEVNFFQALYDEINHLGGKQVLKKPVVGRNGQFTLFTPADSLGLYTYRFETAEGGIRWFDEEKGLLLAVAYGKREEKEGIVLTGGIHRADSLFSMSGSRPTDPKDPYFFQGFVCEHPGKFMFYGDHFAFKVMLGDDNHALVTEVSNPDNESSFQLTDATVLPVPSVNPALQNGMIQRSVDLIRDRADLYFQAKAA